MRRAALSIVIVLSLAGTAGAGQYEDASKAYKRGDYATAAKFYRPLAEQGHAETQFSFGIMYQLGQGVPQDYVQAHLWFNLAASRFSASKKELRDFTVKNRDTVATKMTPAQIAEAQKLAREWKPK